MSQKSSDATIRRKPFSNVPDLSYRASPSAPLTLHQAACHLGIGRGVLRALVNRGEGPPFIDIGARMMFRPESLEKWMAARERKSLAVQRKNKALVKKFAGHAKVNSKSERRSSASQSAGSGPQTSLARSWDEAFARAKNPTMPTATEKK